MLLEFEGIMPNSLLEVAFLLLSMGRDPASEGACMQIETAPVTRISAGFSDYASVTGSCLSEGDYLLLSARRRNQTWILPFVHVFLVVGTSRVFSPHLKPELNWQTKYSPTGSWRLGNRRRLSVYDLIFNQVQVCDQPPRLNGSTISALVGDPRNPDTIVEHSYFSMWISCLQQ